MEFITVALIVDLPYAVVKGILLVFYDFIMQPELSETPILWEIS